MRISEAASSHLAHRAVEALKRTGAKVKNDRLALAEAKKTLGRLLNRDPAAHQAALQRIRSLRRSIPEGSAEHDVLYRQYYAQEMRKKRS